METAEWTLLSLHQPGQAWPQPVGILLRDASDVLHVKTRTDWRSIVSNKEEADIWDSLEEELAQKGRDFGARWVFDYLENTVSHALQIAARQTIPIVDPDETLGELFLEHVRTAEQDQPRSKPRNIEDLLRREIAVNQSLEALIDRVLNDNGPEEAMRICKRMANEHLDTEPHSTTAMEYSRLMRNTLSEDQFRRIQFDCPEKTCRQIHRDRVRMYRRLKKLFDLEIAISRKQKRSCMALAGDWSALAEYVFESLTIARYQCLLSIAGWLFRAGLPGARGVCDAAVFGIFRTVYSSAT